MFELLIVLAIIGIIVVLVLTRFREGQTFYEVTQAAQKLVSDIRRAQGMAISGAGDSSYFASGKISGYGVEISADNKSYLLVARESVNSNSCPSGGKKVIKTVNLQGITVSSGGPGGSVFFASPEPKTCVTGSGSFILSKGSNQKTVTVTEYGKVEAE